MTMKLTLVTGPEIEPVSIGDVCNHSRIDIGDDDVLIEQLIKAAREQAESITNRALITQTWKLTLNAFPGNGYGPIRIPKPPLQSIDSVTYLDTNGTLQSLTDSPTSSWIVETGEPTIMVPDYDVTWPSTYDVPDAVNITFTAGYGDAAEDVPAAIRQWIMVFVAGMYEYREYAYDRPMQQHTFIDRLLDSYRVVWFA
jgi:uncharacterized phiE125 gp8 family phage protein